jgi:hypothetical protein
MGRTDPDAEGASGPQDGWEAVILREPITLTYILIAVLIMAVSGELFTVFSSSHEANCQARNVRLLTDSREGPLQECR